MSLTHTLIHLVSKIIAHHSVVQCAAQPRVVVHRHVVVQPPALPQPRVRRQPVRTRRPRAYEC